jgi:hypothetical protein
MIRHWWRQRQARNRADWTKRHTEAVASFPRLYEELRLDYREWLDALNKHVEAQMGRRRE